MKLLIGLFIFLLHFNLFAQVDAYPKKGVKKNMQTQRGIPRQIGNSDREEGENIISDDFSEFSNWNTIALVDDPNWELVLEEPPEILDLVGEMESSTESNGFALFNALAYALGDSLQPQDAVLEYAFTIDCSEYDHITLSFEQRHMSYVNGRMYIEISDNNGLSYDYSYAVNNELESEVLVQNIHFQNVTEAAAGKEFVKIRFRWTELLSMPAIGWMIDDFRLFESYNNDQRIMASYHRSNIGGYSAGGLEYYFIPHNQFTPIQFSAITENLGAAVQENNKLSVEVTGYSTSNYMSYGSDLGINSLDSLSCIEAYIPEGSGWQTVKYWFDSDSTDIDPFNDTLVDQIYLGNDVYSRDNNVTEGVIYNVEGNEGRPFMIGNVMEVFERDELCQIYVHVSDDLTNTGQAIYAQIMYWDSETNTFVFLKRSADKIINSGENGGVVKIEIWPQEVFPGVPMLVLVGHYGGENEVGFRYSQKTDQQSVLGYEEDALTPFYLENTNAIAVRMHFNGHCLGVGEVKSDDFDAVNAVIGVSQNYPNPFNDQTVIGFNVLIPGSLLITFRDVTGRVVKEFSLNNQLGENEIVIDATEFTKGTYFYTFHHSQGYDSPVRKMIIN